MKLTILICLVLTFLFGACCASNESNRVNENDTVLMDRNNEEFSVKLFLAEKYRPGNCYGMPDPDPFYYKDSDKDTVLLLIKSLLLGKEDTEYMMLAQMTRGVKLTRTGVGTYEFQFSDGQCCTIHHYKGVVEVKDGRIEEKVTEKRSETVPC